MNILYLVRERFPSFRPDVTELFGTELPALMAADAATAEWLENLHEIGATIGYYLIGIHAFAALFHHYLLKDNTLVRMSFKK